MPKWNFEDIGDETHCSKCGSSDYHETHSGVLKCDVCGSVILEQGKIRSRKGKNIKKARFRE